MPESKSQRKATLAYRKKSIQKVHVNLNKNTMQDVIKKIDSVPFIQEYIISLIRADIENSKEVSDNANA